MSQFDAPASRFDPPPMSVQKPDETENPNAVTLQGNNKEQLMRIVAVALRGFCLLFSFLSFVIIVTVSGFNQLDTYNYVLAAALLSLIYNVFQSAKGIFQLATRRELITNQKASGFIDFIGDQVITYLVLSASSAGLAVTNELKQLVEAAGSDTSKEYDKAAAATSMLFFAFLALAVPTLISFHKLFQTLTA